MGNQKLLLNFVNFYEYYKAKAGKLALHFTISHDAPAVPQPNVIGLILAAVNRITKSGRVIGPDERLSPYGALRGVTSEAAYQIK
jgi:hypothetical protein